ncbi:glutamyl-tRNA amidotransferase [candidate division MSBL1 archaeon SCGC-AAA259I09]|uniref:Aspartyl/glutamyl-tRNA(Asn/Gln) amidotransferase subunit B n=2 Tax=candidate division MSBL1 TaxID=215777 RepID=A0A133UQH8_9EURY|nr:glutamyl-tRNA amidotransferase [candidate division MSBL1 archaeon SCGC-AAA259B11]KXA96433.1 glutamyl-tRNA amidotransferase [candidate division MSBL1 archaeon SCGC-AAA259I09]
MKIGFEIHEQLYSQQKLYCDCPTNYREVPPNTNVCPVCTGMPGSKPAPPNKKAIDSAIEIALMLDCDVVIQKPIYIQRKHYDYPDLPSGYQRTSLPIAENGELGGVGIREVHIEEDPGKYDPVQGKVDYNRSGIPLVEVITDPDLTSPEDARDFLRSLIRTLEYTGKVRPEASTLRADTNISLEGGKRVEVKNINSVKGAYRALKYESMRQKRTKEVKRETRAFMEGQMITVPMRSKEMAEDYRYIPDPDLLPILIEEKKVNEIREDMHEAPHLRKKRLMKEYGIDKPVAEVLVSEREFVDLFETVSEDIDPDFASYWFKDTFRKVLNYMDISPKEIPFSVEKLIKLLKMIDEDRITPEKGELVLREMAKNPKDPEKLLEELGLQDLTEERLTSAVEKAIRENESAVEDFKSGKEEALNFLAGQVMQITEGKADPRKVMDILKEHLSD